LLDGGAGDDYLQGDEGNDTYVFGPGRGRDYVSDVADALTANSGDADTLALQAGVAPADVVVSRVPDGRLFVSLEASADRITLDESLGEAATIERISFADGTLWERAEIEARIARTPATPWDDAIAGSEQNDAILSLGGNDELYGIGGRDFLAGGAGEDYLEPAAGPSVIAFNVGDGEDSVDELAAGQALTLSVGGAGAGDIRLTDWGWTLRVEIGTADAVQFTAFAADPQDWPSVTLQLVGAEARAYDLNAVVLAHRAAGSPDAWAAGDALDANLLTVSTTHALGGALAYQYATTGGLSALTGAEVSSVLADAGFGSSPQPILLAPSVNHAPVASASDATLLFDQTVAASSLFAVTDSDGDAISAYEFWDSTAGNGHFSVAGAEQGVNVAIAVPAAELTATAFTAASSIGSDLVWVRANDGQAWGEWKSWYVNSWPHLTNTAPVASAAAGALLRDQSVAAGSLFSVTDADGDAVVQYEFWDDVAGGGYFSVNGVAQGSNPIPVTAADLANLEYVGCASPGTERLWVRASDGLEWGAWTAWNMTTALHIPNAAPEVSAASPQTVLIAQAVNASALFAVTDADADPITQYEFWDSTAGNGHFAVDGIEQPVNAAIPVSAADLAAVQFVGAAATGYDLVWVRASDGQTFGDWKSWYVNSWPHAANQTPVASAANAAVLTGESVAAGSLFTVTDADGDAIAALELWDDVAGGGYFALDGAPQAAGQAIAVSAAQLANAAYVGGASPGTERLWVRANDGLEWGAWSAWNMTSALHIPNAAPVATAASPQAVLLGQAVSAGSLFSVTDADGDAITQYEFWDSTAGNGHFTVNGIEQTVNAAIPVSALDLAATQFVAADAIASDLLWVRASDGQTFGDWKAWYANSVPHLTNAAPLASAANTGLLRSEARAAGSLFAVADADGDAITAYEFWDDVNGGGHFSVNGIQQSAAQAIAVAAGDLANTVYVGGANPGTEQVWVRATDGMDWGGWEAAHLHRGRDAARGRRARHPHRRPRHPDPRRRRGCRYVERRKRKQPASRRERRRRTEWRRGQRPPRRRRGRRYAPHGRGLQRHRLQRGRRCGHGVRRPRQPERALPWRLAALPGLVAREGRR
jgi:hypothetical protein